MSCIAQFFSEIKNKSLGFIGMGVTHNDTIKMFIEKGFSITIFDRKSREELPEIADDFEKAGAKFVLGEDYLEHISEVDILFRTPGMYFLNSYLQEAIKNGVVVTSEMELFFDLCPCKIYAITGTDGKTTTTTILSEMLTRSGKTVHKGGNIGRALLPIVETISPSDVAVVELSSFQLISMRKSPDTAIITNIYPDHLNVHKDMDEYIGAKVNLIAHQNAFSKTVLNFDNEETCKLTDLVRGKLVGFSTEKELSLGAFLDKDGFLCYNDGKTIHKLFHKDCIKIPGKHNVENYLTAISAVFDDVSLQNMIDTAENFGGVEHRIEFVREINGVKFYNDSIATSPVSVIAGLNSFSQKIIVIAGGSDKKLDYNLMSEEIISHVKLLILTGETADKIEAAVKSHATYSVDKITILRVLDMNEAVKTAFENAISGDVVTLSPASASFDCYKNFEERGKHYKSLVNELIS